MPRILVIDDDVGFCRSLQAVIAGLGWESEAVHSLEAGLEKLARDAFDVVVLDVVLPDGNGLEYIPTLRETPDAPEIIIVTGQGDPDGAELAIKSGAWDYITKPGTLSKIRLPISRAVDYHHNKALARPGTPLRREGIIGESKALSASLDMAARAARSGGNVLIVGETGTGKELFARVIHDNSDRREGPFVVVDCAALPESLVESMLFGHEKGAFTTAEKKHPGLIRQAHGGTLFLDEIGELPLAVQKAFLRLLQEHRFRPVGATEEVRSDFRLVAATNRDLERMVADWTFRQDLLFRLRGMTIELPPLRGRTVDIEALCRCRLEQRAREDDEPAREVSPELWGALFQYVWPGNVRELFSALDSALAAAETEAVLLPRHLPVHIRAWLARRSVTVDQGPVADREQPATPELDPDHFPPIREFRAKELARVDRLYLEALLRTSGESMERAEALSGLSRARLYALLRQHGLTRHSSS
ncbi:MAG: sigma-54-dependent transcriptional regulator [Solidesulfovibrio sp. DCME]|uniref:sigma-54-dependent transcriptional regulator n=1 Tax=Solidesulfovibrio sp. DCME TaxID=3447380 RepID=UPI003D0EE3BF